jgi:hypothetical protein
LWAGDGAAKIGNEAKRSEGSERKLKVLLVI